MFTIFGFYKFQKINSLKKKQKILNNLLVNKNIYGSIIVSKEGLVIIDNVLWHGEVVNKDINDRYTKSIRDLNHFISKDKRIEKVMVPFGDGMTVCRKI